MKFTQNSHDSWFRISRSSRQLFWGLGVDQELVEDYEELSDFLVRSGWLKFVQPLPRLS